MLKLKRIPNSMQLVKFWSMDNSSNESMNNIIYNDKNTLEGLHQTV